MGRRIWTDLAAAGTGAALAALLVLVGVQQVAGAGSPAAAEAGDDLALASVSAEGDAPPARFQRRAALRESLGGSLGGSLAERFDVCAPFGEDGLTGLPMWSLLPSDLRDDLTALAGGTPAEVVAGLVEARDDALDGAYGDQVAGLVEDRAERRAERFDATDEHPMLDRVPDELREDVRTALATDGVDARAEALQDVVDGAVAGEYGDDVADAAGRATERWAEATAAC
ncbi:MAG: hypothetical protein CMH83_11215 [Nocardioides sp.]|nr:hypothetical protein [Nocardioides sp.]